jgi:uncharacterized protein YydD (DUF2326 family)
MKLSKLYSNQDKLFKPIIFNDGLNIIIGEIRLPENQDKDTHNLGKSLLGLLIDYCLLKGRSNKFFLFKHFDKFKEFIFFLEIALGENKYITIKRGVENNTKISIVKHTNNHQTFVDLPDNDWTHQSFPSFDKAKEALDNILDLSFIKPWDFRQSVSYALRSEYDYKDVFHLAKFHYDSDWKPYIAHVLGLNAVLVKQQYKLKSEYTEAESNRKKAEGELSAFTDSLDKLEGLILIKEEEIENIKSQLDKFNFNLEDSRINTELVDEIDVRLSELNKQRYYLKHTLKKIEVSLEKQQIIFAPEEAKTIFAEAGILFEGQIKKTYDELIQFNNEITNERQGYLKEELKCKRKELKDIEDKIKTGNKHREEALKYLKDSKTIEKYKLLSAQLVDKKAKVLILKQQQTKFSEYDILNKKAAKAKDRLDKNKILLAENVKQNQKKQSTYSSIKLKFNSTIKKMLDKEALISIDINSEGNLDFKGEIIGADGTQTSESDGKTYRKLLCIAFDIAINEMHLPETITHFSFHDGFLENLDNRKKDKFINMLRKLTDSGYQYIGTLIDSDLPNQDKTLFTEDEIVLLLHDDKNGTLFKMPSW